MEDAGYFCVSCGEWFLVYVFTYGLGLNYCPCCGYEFTTEDLEKMESEKI